MPKPTGRYLESGDARLFVEISGAGPPLLLLHGWPLDRRVFSFQVPELSKHFTVINLDRRGFGKSSPKPDLRRELDDIDTVLDRCGAAKVHLLGMSQGGRLALRYGVTRPQRLRSLILQGAVIDGFSAGASPPERIPLAEYAELAGAGRGDEVRNRWARHPMMRIAEEHGEAAALLAKMLESYTGADLVGYSRDRHAFQGDVLAALQRLTVPTLILTGGHETASRKAHARKLCELLPDVREVILEYSGHLSNLTEPAAYNRAVIDFCTEVDRRKRPSERGDLD